MTYDREALKKAGISKWNRRRGSDWGQVLLYFFLLVFVVILYGGRGCMASSESAVKAVENLGFFWGKSNW